MVGRWSLIAVLFLLLPFAHAQTDEQRLATLATNMLGTTSGDYTLECGPVADGDHKPDILNQLPLGTAYGDYYCILTQNGKITFGTFGDPKDILQSFRDAAFDRQQMTIDVNACNNIDPTILDFQECAGAITGKYPLHVYAYNAQPNDDVWYVIVSESSVSGFKNAGFITGFADWITSFFSTPMDFVTTENAFHHVYYAHQVEKNVTAVWEDTDAVIIYQKFANDFSKTKPQNSVYQIGHNNRQMLGLQLNRASTNDIALWRSFTSSLRIAAGGTPLAGDACGDGKIGFDEECEPALAQKSCHSYSEQYDSGMLKCNAKGTANECLWDKGACVSCEDTDEDGYSSGTGISSVLSFATPVVLGANQMQSSELLTKQLLPLPFDLAAPPNSPAQKAFSDAIAIAESQLTATNENQVYNSSIFASARGTMMQSLLNTYIVARPCVLGTRRTCLDGYWPAAEGVQTNYSLLLPQLKARGATPIFRITLGGCTDGTCGPYNTTTPSTFPTKTTYTAQELRKARAYCFIVASGFDSYWASLEGTGARPAEYLVIGDPKEAGISPDAYDALYKKCAQGIKDAIKSARVIYGIPADAPDNLQQYTYTQGIFQAHNSYDAIYQNANIINGNYEQLSFTDMKKKGTVLQTLQLPLYLQATLSQNDPTLYGARLPLELSVSGVNTLLYDNTSGNVSTNTTMAFWNATAAAFKGSTYRFTRLPSGAALPAGTEALLTDLGAHSRITLFNTGAQQKITIDLSACNMVTARKITKNFAETKTTFDGTLPAYSITTLELSSPATCISPIGTTPACSALVDCNDTDGSVHPGALEICDNGLDETCDGQRDEQPCSSGAETPPAAILCNYNGLCDEGEDQTCHDCGQYANSCPANWTLYKQQGSYSLYTRVGERNNPELLITVTPTQDCYIGSGATSSTVTQKAFLNTTSSKLTVYYNGGSQSMRVYATPMSNKWVITGDPTASGSGAGQSCWACAESKCATLNLEIPFSSTAGCDQNMQCAPLGARWFTQEDCCNCLMPGSEGLCASDPLGCFGRASTGGTGGGGGGGHGGRDQFDTLPDDYWP